MMKRVLQIAALIMISAYALGQSITSAFKIVNGNPSGANRQYDIYVSNTKRLSEVNEYLSSRLDGSTVDFIQINYYDNEIIAKSYMKKQNSDKVSEAEKDRLFKHFIGCYKHNHSTGYENFSLMH